MAYGLRGKHGQLVLLNVMAGKLPAKGSATRRGVLA